MNILAFDTCLGACSAALALGKAQQRCIFTRFELRERQHAETLMGMIGEVLGEAGLDWPGVDAIAVTRGPGSFTGVRVGVAAARGFALALDRPLIAATTLDVMARQAAGELKLPEQGFAVTVDARRGEVYFALYDAAGRPLCEATALPPDEAARRMRDGGVAVAVGSGAELVRAAGGEEGGALPDALLPGLQPDAAVLAGMAFELAPLETPLRPLYLRPPDAKPQSGKAVERRPG